MDLSRDPGEAAQASSLAAVPSSKHHYAERYHLQVATTADNHWLYGYIHALGVKSVFEFGCNQGRHLVQLRQQGCTVAGIDINERAVEAAKMLNNLVVEWGDESRLETIGDESYDLVLTCSVLTHMPDIEAPLRHLCRIARKHALFVETRTRTDEQNFWWRHDYPGDSVYSYYGKQVNSVYQVWHLRK